MISHKEFAIGTLIIAIIMIAIGGLMDITNRERVMGLSRTHYWADAAFLVALSGWTLNWYGLKKLEPNARTRERAA